jgi:hypothetical protein
MSKTADATEPDVATFAGLLLLQEDAEGLTVALRVTESRVTLRSGRSELGAWPASGVSITSTGGGRFEFLAEGDLLIFVPDDLSSFESNPLISALAPLPPPKRWRIRSQKAASPSEDSPAPMFAADEPKRRAKTRRNKPEAATREAATPSHPEEESKRKVGLRRSRPDAEAAQDASAGPQEETKPKRKVRIRRTDSKPATGQAPEHAIPAQAPKAERPGAPPAADIPPDLRPASAGRILSRRRQAWLATIDQAREFDLFGLDRVPVTKKMRQGRTHKHTWDHRVSAGFASRHICTICGKVRISSRRSD